jgi:hypothetical protein
MEYAFSTQARYGSAGVTLTVPEYAAGQMEWHAFRLGAPVGADGLVEPRIARANLLPAPVLFRGMPADRFWQFEDTRVSWDAISVDRTSVATAILLEFALVQSPDWFGVPVELEVGGSLARVRSLIVTDTFGERQRIRHVSAVDGAGSPWRLFTLEAEPSGARDDEAFVLAPATVAVLGGEPVEDLLLRDEQANLAWGACPVRCRS